MGFQAVLLMRNPDREKRDAKRDKLKTYVKQDRSTSKTVVKQVRARNASNAKRKGQR
jgi:hypothetical protein